MALIVVLWLAVFLPDFTLECCLRGTPSPEAPTGICERSRLVSVNPAAAAAGVHPGLMPATALALLPSIRLIERCALREADALHGLAVWSLQFTPTISLQAPDSPSDPAGLLLEIAGSLKLFGGLERLVARLRAGLTENGFSAQTASAVTARGAWLLARHRNGLHADTAPRLQSLLNRLPARLLESAHRQDTALQAIGVRTIGDLMQLPRAGLARRFGPELLEDIDRASGQRPDPRSVFVPPACFDSRLELPAPVEDAERLLFAARRLLLQLCGWLLGRQGGARRITLHAEHERQPATPVRFGPDRPSRDPVQLGQLLTEALRQCTLPAATSCLRLQCEDVHDHTPPTAELFPGAATAHEQIDRLIERLKARLGPAQVSQLHQVAEHRPEYAWRSSPAQLSGAISAATSRRSAISSPATPPAGSHPTKAQHARKAAPARAALARSPGVAAPAPASLHTAAAQRAWQTRESRPANMSTLLRPIWLLDPPVALSERNNRPFWESPLSLLAGPERIESGWWDDHLMLRDYFIAEDSAHRLLWIFRERLSQSGVAWYLHGRFG